MAVLGFIRCFYHSLKIGLHRCWCMVSRRRVIFDWVWWLFCSVLDRGGLMGVGPGSRYRQHRILLLCFYRYAWLKVGKINAYMGLDLILDQWPNNVLLFPMILFSIPIIRISMVNLLLGIFVIIMRWKQDELLFRVSMILLKLMKIWNRIYERDLLLIWELK